MKQTYFLIMIVLGFCSCQKELSKSDATPAEVDVYVAGYEDYVAKYWKNGSPVAKYWKNGNPVILGDVTKESGANCMLLARK